MVDLEKITDIQSFTENLDEFIEDSKKLIRNIEGLDVRVEVSQREDNGYSMKMVNCPKQYKHTLFLLASGVMKMGKIYMHCTLEPSYCKKEDWETELENIREDLKDNELDYLSVLLNNGFDKFLETIAFVYQKHDLIYQLKNIKVSGGQYCLEDKVWNKEQAVFKNNEDISFYQYSKVFKEILG